MKIVRSILFVALGLFILYVKLATAPSTPPSTAPASATSPAPVSSTSPASGTLPAASTAPAQASTDASVPPKVLQVLQTVRTTGQPPEGYVGGRVFENREGHLPAGGDYREFDVDPHNGQRNAERIIVEWNSKKAWYTSDHYQNFTPLP